MKKVEEEIWKTIAHYPNYEVSSFGTIKNKITNKILKPSLNFSGYYKYTLMHNFKKTTVLAHRIIAETFIQNFENKPTVNHKDRNRINNQLENLEWATHLDQNLHKSKSNNIRSHALNVLRICSKMNIVLESYDSLKKASEWVIDNNLSKIKNNNYKSVMSKISAVINNKINCNTSFGYKWSIHNPDIDDDEIWKQIPIYLTKNDKKYYISNKGRIKVKDKIKNRYCKNNCYYVVSIKYTLYYVHRLVALTFLENPENKEFVNHKDGNKVTNFLENLEWATCLENNIHAIQSGLSKRRKKVIQYDTNMNKLNEYNSIIECAKILDICRNCISDNCRGKTKSTKCGYIFRYAE